MKQLIKGFLIGSVLLSCSPASGMRVSVVGRVCTICDCEEHVADARFFERVVDRLVDMKRRRYDLDARRTVSGEIRPGLDGCDVLKFKNCSHLVRITGARDLGI